jgi:hypothetical protein
MEAPFKPDIEITLDPTGKATFTYAPDSPGFNSYKFLQELEKRVGKLDPNAMKWYMCG